MSGLLSALSSSCQPCWLNGALKWFSLSSYIRTHLLKSLRDHQNALTQWSSTFFPMGSTWSWSICGPHLAWAGVTGPNPAILKEMGSVVPTPIQPHRGKEAWPRPNLDLWEKGTWPSPDLAVWGLGIWQWGRGSSTNCHCSPAPKCPDL